MEKLKQIKEKDELGKKIALARSQRKVQISHAKRAHLKPKVEKEKTPPCSAQNHKQHNVSLWQHD